MTLVCNLHAQWKRSPQLTFSEMVATKGAKVGIVGREIVVKGRGKYLNNFAKTWPGTFELQVFKPVFLS